MQQISNSITPISTLCKTSIINLKQIDFVKANPLITSKILGPVDFVFDSTSDAIGNIYVCMINNASDETIWFYNSNNTISHHIYSKQNINTLTLAKYNPNLDLIYVRKILSVFNTKPIVCTDNSGSVFIAFAYDTPNLIFDSGSQFITQPLIAQPCGICWIIIKYDSIGSIVWTSSIYSNTKITINDMTYDDVLGLLIIAKSYNPNIIFYNGVGQPTLNLTTKIDQFSFVSAFDKSGSINWLRIVSPDSNITGINVYNQTVSIVGTLNGPNLIFSESININNQSNPDIVYNAKNIPTNTTNLSAFVAMIKPDTNEIYAYTFQSDTKLTTNNIIQYNNRVYVSGIFNGSITFSQDIGMASDTNSYYLASLDNNLCFMWALKVSNIDSNIQPLIACSKNSASYNIMIAGCSMAKRIRMFDASDFNIFSLVNQCRSIGFVASYTIDGLFNYVISQTNVVDSNMILASNYIYTVASFRDTTIIYNSEKQPDFVLQSNNIGALSIVKYVEWSNIIKLPYVISPYFEKIIYANYLYMPILIVPTDCSMYLADNEIRYIVFNGSDSYVLLAWVNNNRNNVNNDRFITGTNQWIILNGYGIILSFKQ